MKGNETMKVLYIAYSCSPNHGSEDRIGWKIPLVSAEKNQVFVITKAEHQKAIEEYQAQNPGLSIRFFYVDIPSFYKKIYKGFAYSGRLNIWHRGAVALAQQICQREHIDLIHQITPVEFRSIGDYGRIPNVKYVCGPVGGGEYIPNGLTHYAGKHCFQEWIRKCSNARQLRLLKKRCVADRCDAILFANAETKDYMSSAVKNVAVQRCMTEVGIGPEDIVAAEREVSENKPCSFLVAGRMIYRKGHAFLLDALRKLPEDLNYRCTLLGSGPEADAIEKKCREYGLQQRVLIKKRIPFEEMPKVYAETDVLIMPSIRETTGSVLVEAMAKGLPVITVARFGGAQVLDDTTAWLYDGSTGQEFIQNLADRVRYCATHPQEVQQRGVNASIAVQAHLWEHKFAAYQQIYEQLVVNTGDSYE